MAPHLTLAVALLLAAALLAVGLAAYLAPSVGSPEASAPPVAERGVVALAIPAGGVGRVTLSLRGRRRQHPARSRSGGAIPCGAEVLVIGRSRGAVIVELLV